MRIIFTVILNLCLLSATLQASDTTRVDCLDKYLKDLSSDKKITLFKTDGTKIKGKLVSIDFERSVMNIHELYRSDRGSTAYSFSELERVKFRKKGKLSPVWMLAGGIGGGIIGGSLGDGIDGGGNSGFRGIFTAVGIIFLGGLGFLAGTIIPVISSSETVECPIEHNP